MFGRVVAVAVALILAGHAPAAERRPDAEAPASPQAIAATVDRLAPLYGLDPAVVRAVIRAESAFDPNAVSPKNAQGIMQLMPGTATRFGVSDPFDPMQNLRGGMSYLRWLTERFGGNLAKILAAYNAGEGAVDQYGGMPPYHETQDYVARVMHYAAIDGPVPWRAPSPRLGPGIYHVSAAGTGDAIRRGSVTVERTRFGVVIYRGGGAS